MWSFPSIDHEILKELLERVVKCRPTLELAGKIIDASNPQEAVISYFPGDDLFTPYDRKRGLPLGNQTSQFFANVYLNPLDQTVNRELKPPLYVRYVDDFLLFGDSRHTLRVMRARIEETLWRFRLEIHGGKSRVYRTREGVSFLGWRIFPERARLARGNVMRFRDRMKDLEAHWSEGTMGWPEIETRVRAWIAHAAHGETWKLRQQVLEQFAFRRGRVVSKTRGGLEQR